TVQKKNKDKNKFFTVSPLFLLFLFLAATSYVGWLYQRDPAAKELSYGELMQVLNADDPAVRFRNVVVTRDDVRGEIVTTDVVSDGTSNPGQAMEVRPFRTKIGWAGDPELAKRLNARVGPNYKVDQDDSPLKFVYSLVMLLIMVA